MPQDDGLSGTERTLRLRLTWGATLPLAAALAIAVGGLSILRMSARPLGLLIIAITVAEALEPLITRLERRMRRPLAVGVVILGLVACAALAAWLVVPSVIEQGEGLVARLPQMVASVQEWLRQADIASHGEVSRVVSSGATDATHQLVAIPGQLLSMLTDVVVVAFLALYWMAGSPSMREFLLSLVPGHRRDWLRRLLHNVGQAMGGYVRGAAINAVIMGVLAAIGLSIIGVNDPLALGVITALGEPFPYVGPIAAAVPVVLVALVQSPTKALIALGFYCVLQEFEGHVLTPNIMERQTSMPQTLVIFAIVVGAALGGLLGVIVALPLSAGLRVFTLEVIVPAIRRATGAPPAMDVPPDRPPAGQTT
jgi:predicted PurR-regulated permease PerM